MPITIPSSVTDSLSSMQASAGDLTKVGGDACDVMGTLGASVGGDAIAKAKLAEKAIQDNIPKLTANAGLMQSAIADLGPILDQVTSTLPLALGGTSTKSFSPDQLLTLTNLSSTITSSMDSFGSIGGNISSSMASSVADMSASVEALKPQLNIAVQTISAGGCKGIENQLNSIAEGLIPQLDIIKKQLETKTIPSLEPQVNALLDQAKDLATQAGAAFEANKGVLEDASKQMKNSIEEALGLAINV